MPASASNFITYAWYDLNCLNMGQVPDDDVYQAGLITLNEMVSQWANERFFLWVGAAPFTALAVFPDLTTTYTFATGFEKCVRKNLAVALAAQSKGYIKISEPLLEQVASEALAAREQLEGLAPQ